MPVPAPRLHGRRRNSLQGFLNGPRRTTSTPLQIRRVADVGWRIAEPAPPPDRKFVEIGATILTDNCDRSNRDARVRHRQRACEQGPGFRTPRSAPTITFSLRAERDTGQQFRPDLITYSVTDKAGNTTVKSAITVPANSSGD